MCGKCGKFFVCTKMEKQWNAHYKRLEHKIDGVCENSKAGQFGQETKNKDF